MAFGNGNMLLLFHIVCQGDVSKLVFALSDWLGWQVEINYVSWYWFGLQL